MLTREWQPCRSICCGESYWPRFSSPWSPIQSQREGQLAGDRGSCRSRTLSKGRSHTGTATKSRTVYLNDGTFVLHSASAIMG